MDGRCGDSKRTHSQCPNRWIVSSGLGRPSLLDEQAEHLMTRHHARVSGKRLSEVFSPQSQGHCARVQQWFERYTGQPYVGLRVAFSAVIMHRLTLRYHENNEHHMHTSSRIPDACECCASSRTSTGQFYWQAWMVSGNPPQMILMFFKGIISNIQSTETSSPWPAQKLPRSPNMSSRQSACTQSAILPAASPTRRPTRAQIPRVC